MGVCPWIKGSGDTETFILMTNSEAYNLGLRSSTADCGSKAVALQLTNPPNNMHTCLQRHRHETQTHTSATLQAQHRILYLKIIQGYSLSCQTVTFGWASTRTCMLIIRTSTHCTFVCIWEWLNAGKPRPCLRRLQPVKCLIWLQGSSWVWGWRSSSWPTFKATHLLIKRSIFYITLP